MEITALQSFRYGGVQLQIGQTFTATPSDARVLVAIKKAKIAEVKKPKAEPVKAAAPATYDRRDLNAKKPEK